MSAATKRNLDGSVTITTTRTVRLSESQKAEARQMLVDLNGDRGGFSIVQGDGYFAKSIEQKFGLPLDVLAEVSGYNAKKAERQRLLASFQW